MEKINETHVNDMKGTVGHALKDYIQANGPLSRSKNKEDILNVLLDIQEKDLVTSKKNKAKLQELIDECKNPRVSYAHAVSHVYNFFLKGMDLGV